MKKKMLVLAPHTDDGELGMGGTMARFIEEGHTIIYVAFSTCEESLPQGAQKGLLKKELKNALEILGFIEDEYRILNYPVRRFNEFRQDILDDILKIGKEVEPDIVFSPSIRDVHQDHAVIAQEAMRAFKKRTILAYEVPWNNYEFRNQAYFRIEKRHLERKIKALRCYESQANRDYTNSEFTIGQAKMRGVQIGCEYAEVFEVGRLVQ